MADVIRTPVVVLTTAVAGFVLLLGSTAPAWAHISLASSSPGQGASIDALPSTISVRFTGDLQALAEVVVTAPDGRDVAAGEPQVSGRDVSQALRRHTEPGQYALAYRVTSSDGHVVTGRVTFAVGVPYDGAQPASADQTPNELNPGSASGSDVATAAPTDSPWPARDVVVPAALLALALSAWLAARRSPHPHQTSRRSS